MTRESQQTGASSSSPRTSHGGGRVVSSLIRCPHILQLGGAASSRLPASSGAAFRVVCGKLPRSVRLLRHKFRRNSASRWRRNRGSCGVWVRHEHTHPHSLPSRAGSSGFSLCWGFVVTVRGSSACSCCAHFQCEGRLRGEGHHAITRDGGAGGVWEVILQGVP